MSKKVTKQRAREADALLKLERQRERYERQKARRPKRKENTNEGVLHAV